MLVVFVMTALLVAVAELGDKTQMLTLVLAARYGARPVIAGVAVAVLALQLLAVAAGGLVGSLIPAGVLTWVTGTLFIGFGVWTLFGADKEEEVADADGSRSRSPVLGVAAAFFIAELGDKTQIMTMTIAGDPQVATRSFSFLGHAADPGSGTGTLLAVWLGSTVGMLLVNGAAALVGTALGSRLSPVLIKRISGGVFILFGLATLTSALMRGSILGS